MDVHGFEEENITVLMDDGEHPEPSKDNMLAAYKQIVADSAPGDSIFLHYSGHGSKVRDDDFGEEEDGYDEVLVPRDYQSAGMIRDDDLYDILVEGLPAGIHVVSLVRTLKSSDLLCKACISWQSRISHTLYFQCFLVHRWIAVTRELFWICPSSSNLLANLKVPCNWTKISTGRSLAARLLVLSWESWMEFSTRASTVIE